MLDPNYPFKDMLIKHKEKNSLFKLPLVFLYVEVVYKKSINKIRKYFINSFFPQLLTNNRDK